MQNSGNSQKRSYKQQVIELTEMLDNTIRQLSDTKQYCEQIQISNQKLKHALQQKDIRIRFLESQIKTLGYQYERIEKSMRQKEEEESFNSQKNMKLSRLCNSQLENEVEYLKSENAGLVQINEEYLQELNELRRWKEEQSTEKVKWNEKVILIKKDLEKKEELIAQYQEEMERIKIEQSQSHLERIQDYLDIEEQSSLKTTMKNNLQFKLEESIAEEASINELYNFKEENINLRSQLSIIRQRNQLLQQKYAELEQELESRIKLSKKEASAFSHLIDDINRFQEQITQKDLQLVKTREQVLIRTEELKMMMEEREDLALKIENLNTIIRRKTQEIQNVNIEHDIKTEQLKQLQHHQLFTLRHQHEQILEEKSAAYITVKQQLIKVKKYLESDNFVQSPIKMTQLEAENLKMVQRIRSLQEQLAGQDNIFHLSDRSPLVMISETTLFDLEISCKGKDKKEIKLEAEQKQEDNFQLECGEEEFSLEKKIKIQLTEQTNKEYEIAIASLKQELKFNQDKINELERSLQKKQEIIVRQRQQILEVSNINRELDELEKMSKHQIRQYEETKKLNSQYQTKIISLNKDMLQIQLKLQLVVNKVCDKLKIDCKDRKEIELEHIIQYLEDHEDDNAGAKKSITESISAQTEQSSMKIQVQAQTQQQLDENNVDDLQCVYCQERMSNIESLIGINNNIQSKLNDKKTKIEELEKQIKKNQSLIAQNQQKYERKANVYLQKIKELQQIIGKHELREEQSQHENIQCLRDQYQNKLSIIQKQLQDECNQKATYSLELEQKNRQIIAYIQNLNASEEENKKLIETIKQLQVRKLDTSSKLDSYSKQNHQLLDKIRSLEDQIRELKQSLIHFEEIDRYSEPSQQKPENIANDHLISEDEQKLQLRQTISELQTNLDWAQKQIEKYQDTIRDIISKSQNKQNDSKHENSVNKINEDAKENQQLKTRVKELERQLKQSTFLTQKHKHAIIAPHQNVKSKQKKIIQKLKIQIASFTKREQFLMQDRKQLKQQVFLTQRQLQVLKEDLDFERKRNSNLEELYERFRKNKQNEVAKYQSIVTNASNSGF